ncbi:hypothetical protein BHM03_00019696, partial [Ensete ventricosum]
RGHPKLIISKVLTLGIRAAFLVSRCPSTTIHHPSTVAQSNSHNCLKMLPNSIVIPTTADYPLMSP